MTPDLSKIPILTYHKITDRREIGINTLPPRRFAEHLRFLHEEGYTPVTLNNLTAKVLPSRPVIITFDDGYLSVYEEALPLLTSYRFSAIIFIITSFIGKKNTWDANLGGITFSHLNDDQIKELGLSGMEIGSHGMTHRSLTFLDPETARSEMQRSRQMISEITGQPPVTIAYPFGLQNRNIRNYAIDCGFRYGCINMWGGGKKCDQLRLKRIPVYRNDSVKNLQKKITNGRMKTVELAKLRVLSFPALLTPGYQKLVKKMY
jgi:peptidoglycan/xylan/chitin deacetylase (PgdA/CDA1 family)